MTSHKIDMRLGCILVCLSFSLEEARLPPRLEVGLGINIL